MYKDVSFVFVTKSRKSDTVDIYIREMDNWSIMLEGVATDSRISFILTDKNFLGSGHVSQNSYTWFHTTGDNAYSTIT